MEVTIPSHRSEERFFSAPNNPSNISQSDVDDFDNGHSSISGVPFYWEERPGTPKSLTSNGKFEFAFSVGKFESELSAAELFHDGVIKPLKPPPGVVSKELTHKENTFISSPPLLRTRKIINGELFSRRKNRETVDPFEIAARNASKSEAENARGRERSLSLSKSSSRRASRSLSAFRVTEYSWEEDNEKMQPLGSETTPSPSSSARSKGHEKWRLKDFFYFRGSSRGRATGENKLKSYAGMFRHRSFRDTGGPGSLPGSTRNEPVSFRTVSRSVSRDFVQKKRFLPYKQGIVGALASCGFISKRV